jgi:hypothetical protein
MSGTAIAALHGPAAIFDPSLEPPGWDGQKRYTPSTVLIYFEDQEQHLHNIPQESSPYLNQSF